MYTTLHHMSISNKQTVAQTPVVADGKLGWEECGPYDAIHVGAAAAGRISSPNLASQRLSVTLTTIWSATVYSYILLAYWCTELPEALVRQLKPGGRMVIPVGTNAQVMLSRFSKKQSTHISAVHSFSDRFSEWFGFVPWGLLQELVIVDKFLDGTVKKTNELGVRYVPLV